MISFLYDYINSIVIFFSLVFGLKYLIQNDGLVALKILGVQLICNCIFLVIALYVNPVDLWDYPFLVGYIKPMVYLFPTFTFLFHYYLLRPSEKFNYFFLLLFLPFILSILESLPFFLSSNEVKLQELKIAFERHDYFYRSPQFVWFNPLYHIYFKIAIYIISGFLLVRDVGKFWSNQFFVSRTKHPLVTYWLLGIIAFRFITISYTLNTFVFSYTPRINYSGLELLVVGDSIFCILFLLCNPSLLDVYFFRNFVQNYSIEQQEKFLNDAEESKDFISEYHKINFQIEDFLKSNEGYTHMDFTVERLAMEIKIPQRVISFAIKQIHGISVKDYINKMRMEFLIQQYISDEKVRSYSFDYLAEMAGFGSRQTLYSCSQKFYNCSPKELFEKNYNVS